MPLVHSLQEVILKHNVPFVIWCYWEGAPMNKNRALSFEYLCDNIGVPVLLVTRDNLHQFVRHDSPLHPCFEQLSIVHRSDYIRAYLLQHYGGGWHDIKATKVSFTDSWNDFADQNIWMIGRPETENGAAPVFDANGAYMPDNYLNLISVPTWIGRPDTPFSRELYQGFLSLFDTYQKELKEHPARHPREKKIKAKHMGHQLVLFFKYLLSGRNPNYPLPWTVFGNIFHPLCLKYKEHIARSLPIDMEKNAGIYHR